MVNKNREEGDESVGPVGPRLLQKDGLGLKLSCRKRVRKMPVPSSIKIEREDISVISDRSSCQSPAGSDTSLVSNVTLLRGEPISLPLDFSMSTFSQSTEEDTVRDPRPYRAARMRTSRRYNPLRPKEFRSFTCPPPTIMSAAPAQSQKAPLPASASTSSSSSSSAERGDEGDNDNEMNDEEIENTLCAPNSPKLDAEAFSKVYGHIHNITRLCSEMNELRSLLIASQRLYKKVAGIQQRNICNPISP